MGSQLPGAGKRAGCRARRNGNTRWFPARRAPRRSSFLSQDSTARAKRCCPTPSRAFKYKDVDIDGELINELTNDLVNEKGSRDGIPAVLIPPAQPGPARYRFAMKGEIQHQGRRIYQIAFEPQRKETVLRRSAATTRGTVTQLGRARPGSTPRSCSRCAFRPTWRSRCRGACACSWAPTCGKPDSRSLTGGWRRTSGSPWPTGRNSGWTCCGLTSGPSRSSLDSDGFRKTDANSTIEVQREAGEAEAEPPKSRGAPAARTGQAPAPDPR